MRAVSWVLLVSGVACSSVDGETGDHDPNNLIEAPMVGEFPGVGAFEAVARISLGGPQGRPWGSLKVNTWDGGWGIGGTQEFTPEQGRLLADGQPVEFPGNNLMRIVDLGLYFAQVILSARISWEGETVALQFELGEELDRMDGAPSFGPFETLVIRGSLWLECFALDSNGNDTIDDSRFTTEYCRDMAIYFGMQQLVNRILTNSGGIGF